MTEYCYLNGHFIKSQQAKVPVRDRGFRFGDGVFETIAVYQGVAYQWELHMERLQAGLHALDIPAEIRSLHIAAQKLLSKNGLADATLRICISRGTGSEGYLPTGPAYPTVLVEAIPRNTPLPDSARLWLSEYEKPSHKALPVRFKLAQGLNSTLVRMEASKHGCLDGLQLNANGEICEASSANIFWLKGDTLFTPSLECGLLEGTTRAALIRLSPYPVEEGHFTLDALENADAVLLTNSLWQIMPIRELKPTGWQWEKSTQLAKELRTLLRGDISHYIAAQHSHYG